MRPIKFRVWNCNSKEFSYFDTPMMTLADRSDPQVAFKNFTADKIMLGGYGECEQYTGLKDKNGVEVYEGSRLKSLSSKLIITVYWSEKALGWMTRDKSGNTHALPSWAIGGNFEVIHENPGLIGE